jgi:hypothetical protein
MALHRLKRKFHVKHGWGAEPMVRNGRLITAAARIGFRPESGEGKGISAYLDK